jgi:hypothetical protein
MQTNRRTSTIATALVALLAFVPAQVDRLDKLRGALTRQAQILDSLNAIFEPSPVTGAPLVPPADCAPIALPNRRAIPQVRLWTGLGAKEVLSGQDDGVRGTYLAPASQQVARDFVLDRRDRNKALPQPPRGVRGQPFDEWVIYPRCK